VSRVPEVTGAEVVRALERAGFEQLRQTGSHVIMRHPTERTRRAAVPVHRGKTLPRGTLQAILRGAGLTIDELIALL
jgi:predicted RNA binding protein YcfA (HicA-like mRNA interferase family)